MQAAVHEERYAYNDTLTRAYGNTNACHDEEDGDDDHEEDEDEDGRKAQVYEYTMYLMRAYIALRSLHAHPSYLYAKLSAPINFT